MSEHIRATLAQCRAEKRTALVTFLTVGYPNADSTLPLLHALQDGGADIVELGMPFSDPIADGPVIQQANNVSLANGIGLNQCLDVVRAARADGIRVPLMLMGYYNPIQNYGEEKFVREAHDAGVNGFLIVDLPPEEAARFRSTTTHYGLSYIPLVAPSTPDDRLRDLTSGADSFVYVVSRMGTTGHTQSVASNVDELLRRVRSFAGEQTPLALGFGVSTREHFVALEKDADAVVIGSRIIQLVGDEADDKTRCQRLKEYVNEIVGGRKVEVSKIPPLAIQKIAEAMAAPEDAVNPDAAVAHDRFGEFGGQYVPESLFYCLQQTEEIWNAVKNDDAFWAEFKSYYPYMGRPSTLYFADQLTKVMGGAKIWLKREDLNHTGSHKINNALGQVLLAKRMGKKRVIAETGAGQHGVATATVAAKFGLKCTVYMGAEDARRQALNVFRMRLLGADVVEVTNGTRTLRDACSEALRVWVTCLDTTHYVFGTASGPYPFPEMVRTFQSVIGRETREQFKSFGVGQELPNAVVACVGGGSNCSGMFSEFISHKSVKLLGVEAGGRSVKLGENAASLTFGKVGVLHGARGYVLQTQDGQVVDTESISAGLDYPGVGPELCYWKSIGRADFVPCSNADALRGFRLLSETEGIIPALESSHAIIKGAELAASMDKSEHLVICLSGRGDKDVAHVAALLPEYGPEIGWDLRFDGEVGSSA